MSTESALTVGSVYTGRVTGVSTYGVFLRIGTRSGLLHRSQLVSDVDVQTNYPVGQSLRVLLSSIRSDGKLVLSLPAE